jgi:hypothetical protein
MWHKAWAQSSQAVAGRPHHLGRPAMCWCISKNHFVYMFSRGGAQGIQCPMAVQGETWPPGQVAWPAGLTCAPHMPNLQPQHRLTPPINTMVLPSCHTPFRERGNETSIRVPRMFKSHAWQQYDKQMQCYKITSNISYIMTQGSEKDYIKAAELTKRSAAPQA